MYKNILVPLDNSEHSNQAARTAVSLGRSCGAKLTGNHVYAARLHDYRFKQMEFTLPNEYLEETELDRQRKIHDSLITMGLKLISDCYLNPLETQCKAAGLTMDRKMMDGKHHVELLKDIKASGYDLTVLGAVGVGRMKDSQIGSVCERVARCASGDVWVVKRVPAAGEAERDTILVGIDGSPQSFGALLTAFDLAARFRKKLALIGVYDPYLHYQVFNSVVEVLTEQAAKVFRFEEQNQLHEEVIDTGLAQIYQSHLDVGEKIIRERAKEAGVPVEKVLLDGKAFQRILDHARKIQPWLIVVGRIGVHSDRQETALGSNSENLLRLAPCDILLTTRTEIPALDLKAEESIAWTTEALERMKRVPDLVRGIARTGILRIAIEQGHSVITNSVIDEAMDRFMPKYAAQQTEKLAEALAFEKARRGETAICKKCGITAGESDPVRCSVCGGVEFEKITSEMVDRIIEAEGGAEEETAYDGRKLKWTVEAREVLRCIPDAYQKRRAKARIDKQARLMKSDAVSAEFARRVLEEIGHGDELRKAAAQPAAPVEHGLNPAEMERGLKFIARDAKLVPLKSVFDWEDSAVERILRVPSGFMRDRVQERVEALALERTVLKINFALVEEGIAFGRQQMEAMLAGAAAPKPASSATPIYSKLGEVDYNLPNPPKEALNEIGIMSELDRRRSEIAAHPQG